MTTPTFVVTLDLIYIRMSLKIEPRIKVENNKFSCRIHTCKMASRKRETYQIEPTTYVLLMFELHQTINAKSLKKLSQIKEICSWMQPFHHPT